MMQARTGGAPADLPPPGETALAHSAALVTHISDRIHAAGGHIGFAEFMRLVLYAPGLGYYSAGTRKFGEAGDFVTAPEVSPLFSRVLARQCHEVLAALGGGDVLEIGAGSGVLAADLLAALEESGGLPSRYLILEVSAELRERQRRILAERVPRALPSVRWLDALPEAKLRGLVFGNEVVDALPVERFRRTAQGVLQGVVSVGRSGLEIGWRQAPTVLAAAVAAIERRLGRPFDEGYTSEISLGLPGWVADVASVIDSGVLLLSDYGLSESEYYAPARTEGTLRCHYRHRAHEDVLLYPGLQDLTAWVDFSALARAGVGAGLELIGYTTQAHFLIAGGLESELAGLAALGDRQRLALSAQVKTLTLPGEMGEIFRFMAFGRSFDHPMTGFRLTDLRSTL